MSKKFELKTEFSPAGDQPKAIENLVKGLRRGDDYQTLLGATGTGKTFTIANVIQKVQKPTLVIAHNKTLAAQLAQEFRELFPNNAVHYFVSYYDYYQPEAYVPTSDTYIEKESQINEEIERLRHASTQALLTRKDVIIVASVSCIYGLGSPEEYERQNIKAVVGEKLTRGLFIRKLVDIYYERTNADLKPGLFRAVGNAVEIMPVNEKTVFRMEFGVGTIDKIIEINAITREEIGERDALFFFPAKHYVTSEDDRQRALKDIEHELQERLKELEEEGAILEYQRLKRRTQYDLALIREIGFCNGIENYSRHFDGRVAGEPSNSLLSFFPKKNRKKNGQPDFLTVIDESHVTVPQIGGMYAGDRARKETLVDHGFRLPSALDNRPLTYDEFIERTGQTIYVSATPKDYEKEKSTQVVEQIIRPTGLVDPVIDVLPVNEQKGDDYPGQVKHFIAEAKKTIDAGYRVLATTLTKRMAEDMSEFLNERGMNTKYLHSEIDTLERIEILTELRKGDFDVLVGVNLLREGLDLPEVALIGILDADKEGFLRSETSLIQTIGRAARNANGRVLLYADTVGEDTSLKAAIEETERRREIQLAYNKKHGITPKTIAKKISDITQQLQSRHDKAVQELLTVDNALFAKNPLKFIRQKEKQMSEAVKELDFETAAVLRDELIALKKEMDRLEKGGPRRKNK
jgi:excinuclease ABC subunit B